MKKLIFMLSAVIFLFTACQKEEASLDSTAAFESGFHKFVPGDCATTFTTPMIADGGEHDEYCTGTEVGTITVNITDEGDGTCTFYVAYDITDADWVIDATHLYIGPEADIPASGKPGSGKRNPKIGKFEFNTTYDPAVTSVPAISKNVPCVDENGDDITYVIAAHADVSNGVYPPHPPEGFCESLPDYADIMVVFNYPVSYLTMTVTNADPSPETDWFNGVYESWCIDQEHPIWVSLQYYSDSVFCTLNGEADHLVHDPAHLDEVNWILNQGFVGTASTCGGDYNSKDVQDAIWMLVDDEVPPDEPSCRAYEIFGAAIDYGEDYGPFVPGCGDYVGVAFNPSYFDEAGNLEERQKVIIAYPLTCEETAWGYGYDGTYCDDGTWSDGPVAIGTSFTDSSLYGGKAWGWYFYGCQPIPVP